MYTIPAWVFKDLSSAAKTLIKPDAYKAFLRYVWVNDHGLCFCDGHFAVQYLRPEVSGFFAGDNTGRDIALTADELRAIVVAVPSVADTVTFNPDTQIATAGAATLQFRNSLQLGTSLPNLEDMFKGTVIASPHKSLSFYDTKYITAVTKFAACPSRAAYNYIDAAIKKDALMVGARGELIAAWGTRDGGTKRILVCPVNFEEKHHG